MTLYVHGMVERPGPGVRARYVGVHKPKENEAQRPDHGYAELSDDGFVTLLEPLSPSFVGEIAKLFEALK